VEARVENSLIRVAPENGCLMYIWDIEGETCSGICFPTDSSFSSALIVGCAVPNIWADVASALNSRVLEIAIRIKPAAIGARKIISKPATQEVLRFLGYRTRFLSCLTVSLIPSIDSTTRNPGI